MNNTKRNVHNAGPLGVLVRSGQVKKIEEDEKKNDNVLESDQKGGLYFKTKTGIVFNEQELIYIDPKECEPWEYANRLSNEMGDMDELIQSIKENKQLQPALVRAHPKPHDAIRYEIIFGRRRHEACLKLGIPFLVIRKQSLDIQQAIASQDAENKLRKGVSNYSNAILYKRLLNDGVFKTEKELAAKLGMAISSLNELMTYSKIPSDIVQVIPDIHNLSISLAIKINSLVNKSKKFHDSILCIAPQIGKTITSPVKLEMAIENLQHHSNSPAKQPNISKIIKSLDGRSLFTYKYNHKGVPCIVLDKNLATHIDANDLCDYVKNYLAKINIFSGDPN